MADESVLQDLSWAIQSHNYHVIKRCIGLMEDSSIPDCICTIKGCTFLEIAVDVVCAEAVDMLLQKGAVADMKIGNEFLIHRAVARGLPHIVKQLIRYGAKVDSVDDKGETPLFTAVIRNNEEVVHLLLKLGASLDIRNNKNETILEFALMWNVKVKIVKILLNFGVDINARFSNDMTLLKTIVCMFPFKKKPEALLRLVLENGALVRQDNETALHAAALYGLSTPTKILLEHGVNINLKGQFNVCPLTTTLRELFNYVKILMFLNEDNRFSSADALPYRETASMMVQEVVKLQEAKREVIEENIIMATDEMIKPFYNSCRKEIKKMKNKEIVKGVSYFDFLIDEEYKLAIYIRNVEIRKILKKGEYRILFPKYADELNARIKKGKLRYKLLLSSAKHLRNICNFKFPDVIVREIFNYLKSTDLIVLPKVLIRHRR